MVLFKIISHRLHSVQYQILEIFQLTKKLSTEDLNYLTWLLTDFCSLQAMANESVYYQ